MHLGTVSGRPVHLDPAALTRHAVCIGMTGSGKTGLCLAALEGLALAGVPILAVDPKGDLADLALVLDPTREAFAPWVAGGDPGAAAVAWGEGLAASGLGPEDLARFRERVEVTVLTPGSEAGVPVDVLASLTRAPAHLRDDPEGLREYVTGAVTALLGLIDHPADPLTEPAAILLARLLGDAFAAGRDLPLETLLPAIVDPPFERLGTFPLDEFFPREDRHALALALDAVVASPAFAPWRQGVPLDVDAWLAPAPDGRTPIRVLYLAHLDEPRRMFFVTLLMHAVVAWSRRQPGTRDLRALVSVDEVYGYLPPHPRDPPSKWPLLTLMKQARAVGLGVMLATQNPVDLDYKALSNAGTWFIGRLQTKQDRARVLDGLELADPGAGDLDALLADLPPRSFVWRGSTGTARVVRSRHTLCYLRGPLTRREVASLDLRRLTSTPRTRDGLLAAPPPLPAGVAARWLHADGAAALGIAPVADGPWRPGLLARVRVRFDDRGWEATRVLHRWVFPPGAVDDGREVAIEESSLRTSAPGGGRYAPLPGWLTAAAVDRLRARLAGRAVREQVAHRWFAPELRQASRSGEDRAAFEARMRAVRGGEAVEIVGAPVRAEASAVRVDGPWVVWVRG